MKRAWIPFSTWYAWTPAERGEVSRYYEAQGVELAIDMNPGYPQAEFQKDKDEDREDMSLGSRRVKTR